MLEVIKKFQVQNVLNERLMEEFAKKGDSRCFLLEKSHENEKKPTIRWAKKSDEGLIEKNWRLLGQVKPNHKTIQWNKNQ